MVAAGKEQLVAMFNGVVRCLAHQGRLAQRIDVVLDAIGGVVTRVGDETVGEMWSLFDGQSVLNEVDPQFSANIRTHIEAVLHGDPPPEFR